MKKEFTIETEISYEQIYNMVHYNMDHFMKFIIFHICFSVIVSLIIGGIFGLISKSLLTFVIASIIMIVILIVDFVFYKDRRVAHLVTYSKKMNIKDYYKVHYKFCKDHFVFIDKDDSETKIKYNEVKSCIEADDNFYLILEDDIKIIQKNCCSLEEVNDIRKKFETVIVNKLRDLDYQVLNNQRSLKKYVKNENILLTAALVLSIIALAINNFVGNYLVLIIFPVLSLILGIKFRHIKNLAMGIIVGFIIITSFIKEKKTEEYYNIDSFNNSYREVLEYNYIFGNNLPESGFALKQLTGAKKNVTNYKRYTITFENENATALNDYILGSANWILDAETKDYYAYYNITSNKYNDIRDEGEFKMVDLVYIPELKTLTIEEYTTIK